MACLPASARARPPAPRPWPCSSRDLPSDPVTPAARGVGGDWTSPELLPSLRSHGTTVSEPRPRPRPEDGTPTRRPAPSSPSRLPPTSSPARLPSHRDPRRQGLLTRSRLRTRIAHVASAPPALRPALPPQSPSRRPCPPPTRCCLRTPHLVSCFLSCSCPPPIVCPPQVDGVRSTPASLTAGPPEPRAAPSGREG